MTQTPVAPGKLFVRILDPASRVNPYPLYARLRETPVSLQEDGTYVVSTYQEISLLLHDPRISSDMRKSAHGAGALAASENVPATPPFIFTDPPEHTRLRRLIMHQFTPQRIAGMRAHIEQAVQSLLDAKKQDRWLDLVQDVAYPLPVTIICRLLGVPPEAVTALKALARRLEAPRLVTDPPPYRKNAALRGPEHLPIAFADLNE